MCHFTAESVGERDTIQHRCELISFDPGKRSKGKSFDLSLSTQISSNFPSLVCSIENAPIRPVSEIGDDDCV